jgi:AraC-like DNA-binding protein
LYILAVMDDVDEVTMWRAPDVDGLWMAGRTTGYRVDPVGEYVIGVTTAVGYHLRRGRHCHRVGNGQLVVLDPSTAHEGTPLAPAPWDARLLVLELGTDLDIAFPDPLPRDRRLAEAFLALHALTRAPASTLERETAMVSFLDRLRSTSPEAGSATSRANAAAVERAVAHLREHVAENVTLDELALVAHSSKCHLVRQFRTITGTPPHAYQLALRIVEARRMLERGWSPADVATRTGFVDQSHFHRHFRRRLGITPGRYAAAFRD